MIESALRELLGVEPHLALTYFLCVIIGVMINWAKRARELNISLTDYWTANPGRVQTAIVGTLSAFCLTIITDPDSGKITYIAIGFALDNILDSDKPASLDNERLAAVAEAYSVSQAHLKKVQGIK